MFRPHSAPSSLASLFSCALSYALVASLLPPLAARRVKAAPEVLGADAKAAPARQAAARRNGELIVRFREGLAEELKDALASSRGGRRKSKLT